MQSVKQAILDKLEQGYQLAENRYGRKFTRIPVMFNLKGRSAGQFWYNHRNYGTHFRFNLQLAVENGQDYINRTPLHELSHYIVRCVYPYRCKPHGHEWQSIMTSVMKQDASRCHSFDTSKVRRSRSRLARHHEYVCACKTHLLTNIRHMRIVSGERQYICRNCKTMLTIKPKHSKISLAIKD